jgi:hypothetical protein
MWPCMQEDGGLSEQDVHLNNASPISSEHLSELRKKVFRLDSISGLKVLST